MQTLITFILIFAVIVVVHEFGHFYFAKRSGILVREFSIGMGPKLFQHRAIDGTTYTIRILPIGGYVRMAGSGEDSSELPGGTPISIVTNEDGKITRINLSTKIHIENAIPMEVLEADLEDKLFIQGNIPGAEEKMQVFQVLEDASIIEQDGTEILIAPKKKQFQSARLRDRMMTNFAGPMNNFILGILLFVLISFLQGGVPVNDTNKVGEIVQNSPAQKAGMKENDAILSIEGKKIKTWDDFVNQVAPNPNKKLSFMVNRGGKEINLEITPTQSPDTKDKQGMIGVKSPMDRRVTSIVLSGFTTAWKMSLMIFKAIGGLFTGFSLNKLGGPVMIYKLSSEASSQGLISILSLMAMLSMNLGFMNLMPIPALDGGKLLLNLLEGIRKKPLSEEKEGLITLVGVGVMVLLMILVTWNDITRFFIK
ncbi:MAG: RIP metalloprotease RseP [Streptococcaceae bacterium]|jgi:regulator of sigma E protease|nr:RIP metalloprotease RseP [Streptococcaceae bacterium]